MKKPKRKKSEPKFRVGQVVRMDMDFKREQKREYLKIVAVWPWLERTRYPWGYTLSDNDKASERWLRPLTAKEIGPRRKRG